MWGVLGIQRGRRRTSTGCSLLWCSFHFFLFEYLWNAIRVAWLRAPCKLHIAVCRLQTLRIPLWVINWVAGETLWTPRATKSATGWGTQCPSTSGRHPATRTTCNFQIWRNKCKAEKYLMDCVRTIVRSNGAHDVPEIKSTVGAGAMQEIPSEIERY